MATMTIEYNERDKHVRHVLTGLLGSGIIHRKNKERNKGISSFKVALQETKVMSSDIVQNGIAGYKTLDDLLNED